MHQKQSNGYALVIGVTGGIGMAMASLLLEQGLSVFGTLRNNHTPKQADIDALEKRCKDRFEAINMDVLEQDSIKAAFTYIKTFTGKLHLVINCTGLLHQTPAVQPEKRIEDAEAKNLAQSFAINATAPLLIARYALPLLRHKEKNILANLSARVGSISDNYTGGWYGYRASKAAQNMITRNLAIEFHRRSPETICVGLHPGTVNTGLSKPFQKNLKPGQLKTPAQSAGQLYNVLTHLTKDDSGKIFAWDGSEILP